MATKTYSQKITNAKVLIDGLKKIKSNLPAGITDDTILNLENLREKRPLIAGIKEEELPNFIGQHLMERNHYYSKAKIAVLVNDWDIDKIVSGILTEIEKLGYEMKNKN